MLVIIIIIKLIINLIL